MVGPICGRYVGAHQTRELCESISHPLGFSRLQYLLVVKEDESLFTIGGSHRLQVVCGIFPVRRVPHKVVDIEHLQDNDGQALSVKTHAGLLVS